MSKPVSGTVYYLFIAAIVFGIGGFVIATLSATFGYPQVALVTFYVGLAAILLLIVVAAATLAGAVRSWRRSAAR